MISDLCERGACETCFEDELDACGHECHGPLDCPAVESTGDGRAQDAAGSPGLSAPASALPRSAAGKPLPGPVLPTPPGRGAISSPQPSERQAAGIPFPGTGREDPAADLRMPSRPGRGADTSPAGGALDGARGVPAGSTGRTYTIALPAGMKLLSLNGREHWSERARRTEALKTAAWAVAHQAKVPMLDRVSVVVEYQPPDRRHRDAENTCAASGKACIDGIVAAGVLEDDECPRYVVGIWCTIGELYPKGRLVLHLTEAAATGGETS